MAALAGDLSRQILGHSDAAKAFRPWWDTIEDNLLYSFVILGLVLLPMTFLSGTPVECTIHPKLWKDNFTISEETEDDPDELLLEFQVPQFGNTTDYANYAKLLRSYSKKYCTEMNISPFLLYLPFVMMIIPAVLIAVEKFFIKFYSSDEHLEVLYKSLVKTSLDREDVATMERENIKNSHEIRQTFRRASRAHDSYLWRTSVELVVSVFLLIMFTGYSHIKGLNKPLFDCDVHGILFSCIIPNSRFYYAVYLIGLLLLLGYISLTFYNLLWLLHPKVATLERALSGCKRRSSSEIETLVCPRLGVGKDYTPEIRLEMYYDRKGRDFRLLMNLLAEQSDGLAQSFRILAVFDKHFQRLWRPQDYKVIVQRPLLNSFNFSQASANEQDKDGKSKLKEETPKSVWVVWNDAAFVPYMSRTLRKTPLEYTVEMTPATEAPLKSYLYHDIHDFAGVSNYESKSLISSKKSSMTSSLTSSTDEEFGLTMASMYKYSTRFDGLEDNTEYTVSISTELDGKTITQTTMTVNSGEFSSSKSCVKNQEPSEK